MKDFRGNTCRKAHRALCAAGLFVLALAPQGVALAAVSDDVVMLPPEDALAETEMSVSRGSGGTYNFTAVSSDQNMTSTSTGNALYVMGSLTNGTINAAEGFGGSGIGSFVLNTGNNSVINSGVSLSVLMLQQ